MLWWLHIGIKMYDMVKVKEWALLIDVLIAMSKLQVYVRKGLRINGQG
jgi:hypothetical protein